jgi:hypothetical protein
MSHPYSIRIFLPGGDPAGLRTIEKSNWTGAGLVIPRSSFADARSRRELKRAGIYILVGPPEESGLQRIYIGEGDPVGPRLDQHASKKDFWISAIAFTSKDENLNKAHVQYLESRLVELATKAKRCVLDNGNVPALPSLAEAEAADAEGFLAEIQLCLPLLGLSVFTPAAVSSTKKAMQINAKGIAAKGLPTSEGFVVIAGSGAVIEEVASCPPAVRSMRAALLQNGVLKLNGESYVFTQDYVFGSPSTAASVVQGRSANGRVDWKDSKGRTLNELQEAEAENSQKELA